MRLGAPENYHCLRDSLTVPIFAGVSNATNQDSYQGCSEDLQSNSALEFIGLLANFADCSRFGLVAAGLDGFEFSRSPVWVTSLESAGGPMSTLDTASLVFGATSFTY